MIGDFVYVTICSVLIYYAISAMEYIYRQQIFKEVTISLFKFMMYVFMYSVGLRVSCVLANCYMLVGDLSANIFACFAIFMCAFSVVNYVSYIVNTINLDPSKVNLFGYSMLYAFMPVMFLLLCSTLLCGLNQYCSMYMFFMIFMFLSVFKIAGNFTTKVGDIVADYDKKIVKKQEEDKGDCVFSFVDNIGDIIGDLFGTIVDYCGLLMLCIVFMCMTNSFTMFNYLFFLNNVLGKIIIYSVIMSIMIFVRGNRMFFVYTDYVAVLSAFISHLFYVTKILCNLGIGYKSIYSVFYLDMMNLSFFSFAIVSISLLTCLRFYDKFAICFIKLVETMPIVAISVICCFSYVFAYLFINYVHFTSKFIFWLFNTDISALSFLNHVVFFGLYYVFKTVFGAMVDSSCGFFKKIMNNSTDESQQQRVDAIETILENYDATGNLFKLETKLFFVYLAYVLYEMVAQNVYKLSLAHDIMSIVPFIVSIVFMALCYKMYTNKDSYDFSGVVNLTTRYAFATFYIITNLLFTIMFVKSSRSMFYMKILHSGIMYVFLVQSVVFYFLGSMFDIIKKKVETNEINVESNVYNLLLQLDLIGDCFKDVIGPFMFSISNFMCFVLIFIK